ncbi:MAG: DUF2652 domain-containing protein [SAR324 cluster bacterium]|nr:DUF2652 domain-containing protein [SAR324 cluster bacterium]
MAVDPRQGLMLIPDISGYTEFLHAVELSHSGHIISDLLETLIAENRLGLTLSEVEGDALFFYRMGPAPTLEQIQDQVNRWFIAFHARLNLLQRDNYCRCGACNFIPRMTLKFVGHYGEMGLHKVGGRSKVIGTDVILVHRLLKNTVRIDEYFFLTKMLYAATGARALEETSIITCEEEYPVFGKVSMIVFRLAHLLEQIPPTPPVPALPSHERLIREEIEVNCTLDQAVQYLSNLENQLQWLEGIRSLEMDRDEPLRSGQHHVCVIGNTAVHQSLEHITRSDEEFKLALRVKPPRLMLKSWYGFQEARRDGDRLRLSLAFGFNRRPLMGWIFDLVMLPRMRKMLRSSLQNLKAQLEGKFAGPSPHIDSATHSTPPAAQQSSPSTGAA